jgi:hypothetical protein
MRSYLLPQVVRFDHPVVWFEMITAIPKIFFRKYLTGPALRYNNKHMFGSSMNLIALILGRTKNIPVFLLLALIMAALGSFLIYVGKRSITECRARMAHYTGVHEFTGKPAVFIGCVQLLLGALALLAAVSFLILIFD